MSALPYILFTAIFIKRPRLINRMKSVILAGGYAKRLWPLTLEIPKPLLLIGSQVLLQRIMNKISEVPEVDEIIITTNMKFEDHFKRFLTSATCPKPVRLFIEPTASEGEKLGAIGALHYLLQHLNISEDTLIIAGDNLFEFSLKEFIAFHNTHPYSSVAVHDIRDIEQASNFGVIKHNGTKIIELVEKPTHPESSLISTACYCLSPQSLALLHEYIATDNPRDTIGHFIGWLVKKAGAQAFVFQEPWYDIGSHDELAKAQKLYNGQ